jgi:hypothetical protein
MHRVKIDGRNLPEDTGLDRLAASEVPADDCFRSNGLAYTYLTTSGADFVFSV